MGKLIGLLCCLCILPQLAGCAGSSASLVTENGIYFDTAITVSVETSDEKRGNEILDGCMNLCRELEMIFSRTREDSELYQVNHRTSSTVTISDELAEVIDCGLRYYELSEGKLDITIAPVLELWDFKNGMDSLPDEKELKKALEKVDASAVHLSGNQLIFDRSDTEIDLGALAKGYAADRLKAYLLEQGAEHALINLGGNVNTLGTRPDGTGWRVGIQKPFEDRGVTDQVLKVTDQSVVSSGTYERYFELDGKFYHHILDPDTGYPAITGLAQVTIVSQDSLTGDALSTTCLLLGEEKAEKLLAQFPDVEAYLVKQDASMV